MGYFTLIKIRIKNIPIIGFGYCIFVRIVKYLFRAGRVSFLLTYNFFFSFYERLQGRERVRFFGFWDYFSGRNTFWILDFIRAGALNPKKKPIFFYSVFVERTVLERPKLNGGGGKNKGIKIFYTGENVHSNWMIQYQDNALPYVNLSCGFDYLEVDNYVRIPYWLIKMFLPTMQYKGIKKTVAQMNNPLRRMGYVRENFAALIANHDNLDKKQVGVRQILYDGLSAIDRIDCPGKLLHNTDSLHKEFKNNKINFLREYKFNICPENSNTKGYVTEKIIDSFRAGCIPIYWGSEGYIEPDIINPKSYLYFDGLNLLSLQEEVRALHTDRAYYEAFCRHPPFLPDAADIIYERFFLRLEVKLKRIFM